MEQNLEQLINNELRNYVTKQSRHKTKKFNYLTIYQTKKQHLLIRGYIRRNKLIKFHHGEIVMLITIYSQFPDVCPETDPANVVTETEIKISDKYRLEGNKLFKFQHYKEAMVKYTTSLKLNPNDYRVHCNISLCHLRVNELSEAYKIAWRTAIYFFPSKIKCWYRLAYSALKLNDYTVAFIAFRTVKMMSKYQTNNMCNSDIDKYFHEVQYKVDCDKTAKQWIENFYSHAFSKLWTRKIYEHLQYLCLNHKQQNRIFNGYMDECEQFYKSTQWSKCIKYRIDKTLTYSIPQYNFWVISYTSSACVDAEHNKRRWIIDIICQQTCEMIMMHTTFGKPNGKQVVDAMLMAITSRLCSYDPPYRPKGILITYRLKDEFDFIKNQLLQCGIVYLCALESKDRAMSTVRKYGTDPNGYNYCRNKEDYILFTKNCSNMVCTMTRDVLWTTQKKKFTICSGCSKNVYCCRKCQKYDWKRIHRTECVNNYKSTISMIFDRWRMR